MSAGGPLTGLIHFKWRRVNLAWVFFLAPKEIKHLLHLPFFVEVCGILKLTKTNYGLTCPQVTTAKTAFKVFIVWTHYPTTGRPPPNKLGHTDLTHDYF